MYSRRHFCHVQYSKHYFSQVQQYVRSFLVGIVTSLCPYVRLLVGWSVNFLERCGKLQFHDPIGALVICIS